MPEKVPGISVHRKMTLTIVHTTSDRITWRGLNTSLICHHNPWPTNIPIEYNPLKGKEVESL